MVFDACHPFWDNKVPFLPIFQHQSDIAHVFVMVFRWNLYLRSDSFGLVKVSEGNCLRCLLLFFVFEKSVRQNIIFYEKRRLWLVIWPDCFDFFSANFHSGAMAGLILINPAILHNNCFIEYPNPSSLGRNRTKGCRNLAQNSTDSALKFDQFATIFLVGFLSYRQGQGWFS